MLRRRFLNKTDSNNLNGSYNWCIKYTASKLMKPFGKDIDDIKREFITAGYRLTSDAVWINTQEPIRITHDTYNTVTGEGVIGFKGTEPGLFLAYISCIDPEGTATLLVLGLFIGSAYDSSLFESLDNNVTKLEFPPNTGCALVFNLPLSVHFGALQELILPQNLQFLPYWLNMITSTAPITKKSMIFKKEWTGYVHNVNALDFPHSMAMFAKWIVEEGHPTYDSREDCGCIIETAINCLHVGCSDGFIPNSVTSIGTSAFYRSNIENLYIPDSVTDIGETVFYLCPQLKSLSTANIYTFTHDGDAKIYMFENCNLLNDITYRGPMADLTPYINYIKRTLSTTPATVIHCTDGDVVIK